MTVKKVAFVIAITAMTIGFQQLVMHGFGPLDWSYFVLLFGGGLLGYSHDAFVDSDKDE